MKGVYYFDGNSSIRVPKELFGHMPFLILQVTAFLLHLVLKQHKEKNLLEKNNDFELPSNPTSTIIMKTSQNINIKVNFVFRDI